MITQQVHNLTDNGWTAHSGTGSFITLNSSGLTFTGYANSGIGNSVNLNGGSGSREDDNKGFTPQNNTGTSIYFSRS